MTRRLLYLALLALTAFGARGQADYLIEEFSHMSMQPMPLMKGDTIAIVSPASIIRPQTVYGATEVLRDQGWEVRTGTNTFARCGSYAGTDAERLSDLVWALTDSNVDAVICSRGGYGVVHLLDSLSRLPLEQTAKWVVGFSDITALHSLLTSRGIPSIHASMTEHIARGADDVDNAALFKALRGEGTDHHVEASPRNRKGSAKGRLVGGNLSVLAGLIGTPYDVIEPGTILFIEDVNEPVYKLERIMYQLKLSGQLSRLNGLIVGKFSKCTTDADNPSIDGMIQRLVREYDYPVAYDVPIGHVSHNIPMICGAEAELDVTAEGVHIKQSGH